MDAILAIAIQLGIEQGRRLVTERMKEQQKLVTLSAYGRLQVLMDNVITELLE